MSRTALLIILFEVVGYGVLLNFGYPATRFQQQ